MPTSATPADNDTVFIELTDSSTMIFPRQYMHDFFIYYFLRFGFTREKIRYMACQAFEDQYDEATIDKWLGIFMRRFCNQQFKRNCMPDGPKVVSVSLSPRGDWRMPSDASCI